MAEVVRKISHGEAKEIAQRLINSHFNQEPSARVSIPARPNEDDDLLLIAYIDQQELLTAMPPPRGTFYCHPDDLPYWEALRNANPQGVKHG